LECGEIGIGFRQGGKFKERATSEAANIGVFVIQHREESRNGCGVGSIAKQACCGGTGEPVGVLSGLAKKGGGIGGGENSGCLDRFAADGGVGIAEGVA
jgi:hypothetical protein